MTMPSSNLSSEEITVMLRKWSNDNREALDALVPLVYKELHDRAHQYLRIERSNHTLQTTALINETYLRLAAQKDVQWLNRAHFFGLAATMMRRILVDYAKAKHRIKRGNGDVNYPLSESLLEMVGTITSERTIDLIALDQALDQLAALDEQQCKVVELRYFGGMTVEETAEALGISTATVKRDWNVAKAWLYKEIQNIS